MSKFILGVVNHSLSSLIMSAVAVGELGILTECFAFCTLMFPICSPLWQVAWGWASRTPTTLPSRCVCQGNLRPTGCCVEWIAPWLSAPITAFWPVAASGKVTFSYRLLSRIFEFQLTSKQKSSSRIKI